MNEKNNNVIESLYDSILQEDLEYISNHYDFSVLFNKSILITGATGLLGSQLVKLFLLINRKKKAKITIYALIRDAKKGREVFSSVYNKINFVYSDIIAFSTINEPIDYIIHGASITISRAFIEKPVETIDTAYIGTRNMLELARSNGVKGFVYLSSMEVFGITDSREISESDYGYIDILNPRSSYSEGKRICECLCACYAKEYKLPIKIARLVQVVGAGIDYYDTRVPAQFARSVIENKDIILKTLGKTRRPSIYTRDAILGICTVLLKGNSGEAYNIANKDATYTILEIAEMVAKRIANNRIKVIFDLDTAAGYAPDLNLDLNINLIKSLGWKAEIGLEESYRRMIQSMQEQNNLC